MSSEFEGPGVEAGVVCSCYGNRVCRQDFGGGLDENRGGVGDNVARNSRCSD